MLPEPERIEMATAAEDLWRLTGVEAAVVGVHEGERGPDPPDDLVLRALEEVLGRGPFRGVLGETLLLPTLGRLPYPFLVLTGLGRKEKASRTSLRRAFAHGLRACRKAGLRTVGLAAPEQVGAGVDAAEDALLGAAAGAYRFNVFQSQRDDGPVRLVLAEGARLTEAQRARAEAIAEGVALARHLVNLPPNHKYPEDLAAYVAELGRRYGFGVEILSRAALEAMGAGGIVAVGQGSDHPPCAVLLSLGEGTRPPLAFLGKGMTFDSGGLSLKTASGMATMKSDMAGAAAVVGAFVALARLRCPIPLQGGLMLAENMTGGSAQRPGDVLSMLSGKTVEMLNSDAEGRLVLADGVELLRRRGAAAVVDLATLTGACVVALGDVRAGLLGNDEGLIAQVLAAADLAGERLWRMPADEEYRELLKSHVADLKNVGGRSAGMQTGALFVGAFAEGLPWAHLDIAGVAFQEEDKAPLGYGGTGFGVETLVRLALGQAAS